MSILSLSVNVRCVYFRYRPQNYATVQKSAPKKVKRTEYWTQMIRDSTQNIIQQAFDGWQLNDDNELEIQYFNGNPYPDNIANISIDEKDDAEDDEEEDDNAYASSSNENEDDYENDDSSDEEPKN